MPGLPDFDAARAIRQDVEFDYAGASDLAQDLLLTAATLELHSDHSRPGMARRAREEWRGAYGDQFDRRMSICLSDGRTLAQALRAAAKGLDALAAAARREQERREAARAWEEEQRSRNILEKAADVVGDLFIGEDDIPPGILPGPEEEPVIRIASQVTPRH